MLQPRTVLTIPTTADSHYAYCFCQHTLSTARLERRRGDAAVLARKLSERGHVCAIVTLTPEREESVGEIDGIPVCYLPLANVYWPHEGRRPVLLRPVFQALDAFNPVMQRRIAAVLGRLQPDVVNAHNLQGFSVSAWSAAARLGIPLVQTLHDYYTVCPRSAMWRPGRGNCARQCPECRLFSIPRRRLSGLPAAVTCVSRRVFNRITATGMFAAAQAGRQPVRIIRGNNPDEELPTLPPTRPGGPWRFGSMSRIDPAKGLENLIDALAGLPPGSATLAIAGNGPEEYTSLLRARAAGTPGIEFLGHVAPTSFFHKIDTLVIPSIWEDPFPRYSTRQWPTASRRSSRHSAVCQKRSIMAEPGSLPLAPMSLRCAMPCDNWSTASGSRRTFGAPAARPRWHTTRPHRLSVPIRAVGGG